MTTTQVRNDSEGRRRWDSLSVDDPEVGHPHTLELDPGETAEVDLPEGFTDPHLVQIDKKGNVVPWSEPKSEEEPKAAPAKSSAPPAPSEPAKSESTSAAPEA